MNEFRQQSQHAQQATQQLQNSLNSLTTTTQKQATATSAAQKEMRQGFSTLATTTRQSTNQMQQSLGSVSVSIARGGEATKKLASDVRQGFAQAATATAQSTQAIGNAFTALHATARQGFAGTTAAVKQLQGELQRMGQTLQGITNIERTSTAQLAEMQRQTALLGQSVMQGSQSAATFGTAWGHVRAVLAGVGIGIVIRELGQLVGQAIEASTQLTAFQNAFKTITGSSQGAGAALQFVRTEAQRIGIDFTTAAQSFQGLAAASRGTALEGEGAQKVFTAVAQAGRVMGLSTDQLGGALTALQQIMSKGTVQSEELRGQLGERIPGAFQIAARAMGVTTAQLGKMLEQGQVLSDVFLPRFAAQLEREFAGGVEAASRTFAAEMTRMQNATRQILATFGDFITRNPAIITALRNIGDAIKALADIAMQQQGRIMGFFTLIGNAASVAASGMKALAGENVTVLSGQIDDMNRTIAGTTAQLENQKKIADSKFLSGLYNVTGFAGAESIDAVITGTTQRLEEQKTALEHLRVARMEAMRVQAGLGAFETPAQQGPREQRDLGESLLGGGTQGAGGKSLLQRTREELDALSGINVNKINEINATLAKLRASLTIETEPGRIAGTREEIRKLEEQLANLGGRGAKTAVDGLERTSKKIQELQAYLANPPKDATTGEIEQARNTLNDLLNKQLPEVLQGFAKAKQEADGLRQVLASGLGTPVQRLALQDQLDELNRQQLPESLRGTQALKDEIASLQRLFDARLALNLDDAQIDEVMVRLRELREQVAETQLALNRLSPQQRQQFQETHDAVMQGYERGLELQREQVTREFEIAQATATSTAQRQQNYEALTQRLEALGASTDTLRQRQHTAALEDMQTTRQQAQIRIEQDFRLRQVTVTTEQQRRTLAEARIRALEDAGVDEKRIQEEVFNEQVRQLEVQTEAWQEFTETVRGFLAENIFDFIKGETKSLEDVLEGLADTFIRIFSEDLSKSIAGFTTSILQQITGQVPQGAPADGSTSGTAGGGGGGVGGILNAVGPAVSNYFSNWFGGGASASSSIGGVSGAYTGMAVPNVTYTGQGLSDPGGIGSFADTPTGGSAGGSMGGYGSAIGAGISTGYLAADLFEQAGLRGKAGAALSGVVGGAVAGTMIAPGWGTLIGAVVGGIIGAIAGKDVENARIDLTHQELPRFQASPLGVRWTTRGGSGLEPVFDTGGVSEEEVAQVRGLFQATGDQLFNTLQQQISQLPQQFQRRVVDNLNDLTMDFEGRIDDMHLEEMTFGELMEQLEDYLTNDVPREFELVFGGFVRAAQKIAPIAQAFELAIDTLKENEARLMAAIRDAKQNIEESLFTPAQLFETRQDELQRLLTRFDTGTPAQQLKLAPQITGLTQEIFGLARNEEVLGTDIPALKELQTELQKILTDVEGVTKERFAEQKDIATKQLDILEKSLVSQIGIEHAMAKSLTALDQMNQFFQKAFAGSFATGGEVPQTGLALLHHGEVVIPAAVVQREHLLHERSNTREVSQTMPQPPRAQPFPFVGAFQGGGLIPQPGLALLHAGEVLTPAPQPQAPQLTTPPAQTQSRIRQRIQQADSTPTYPFLGTIQPGDPVPVTGFAIVQAGQRVQPVHTVLREREVLEKDTRTSHVFHASRQRQSTTLVGTVQPAEAGRPASVVVMPSADAVLVTVTSPRQETMAPREQSSQAPAWPQPQAQPRLQALPFVGAYQQGGAIPTTGMAVLHAGEVVLPAAAVQRERIVSSTRETFRDRSTTLAQQQPIIQHFPFLGSFQHGGRIDRDGMALVHAGETVMPAVMPSIATMHAGSMSTVNVTNVTYGDNNITVNVPQSTGTDPQRIAEYVAAEVERRQRLQQRPSAARRG